MSADRFSESDFEGELPADLAALGEQLQADAQRLSSVYPACAPPTKLSAALVDSTNSWSRPTIAAVAMSAAALLLIGAVVAFSLGGGREEATIEPASPALVANNRASTPPEPIPTVAEIQPVSFRPGIDVNGPELEGLLDLWQEQAPAVGSISF